MADDDQRFDASKGRDLDEVAIALPRVLCHSVEGVSDVRVGSLAYPVGAGRSNETVLFEASWERQGRTETVDLVLRIAPDAIQLFLEPDIRVQYELLVALHDHGSVNVPRTLLFEEDPSLFGQPFFVMERVRGRVPVSAPVYSKEGWLHDATPSQRRIVWETAIEQLARIHNVPLDILPCLSQPAPGETGLDAQLSFWRRSMSFSAMGEVPDVLHVVVDWLDTNRPATHVDGLSWGDARIGNMMFGDDFRLRAVLDWEQASRAGGLRDLGWWLFFDDYHSIDQGVARLDGLGTRQETIDYWQEHVGQVVTDLTWYEVFAGFSLVQLWLRNHLLLGMDTDQAMATNAFVPRMLELMGESATTAGVRR